MESAAPDRVQPASQRSLLSSMERAVAALQQRWRLDGRLSSGLLARLQTRVYKQTTELSNRLGPWSVPR